MIRLRLALPLIALAGFLGWTVGGHISERAAASAWTVQSITHHAKGDKAPCPPFDQCTPRGDWNAPNCKCWDSK